MRADDVMQGSLKRVKLQAGAFTLTPANTYTCTVFLEAAVRKW